VQHADFYVAAATALPVLVIAGVVQTNFPKFFEATWQAYGLGSTVVFVLVAGETAPLASLETGRDSGWGRALACGGLGVAGFWLVGPMLASRFLPDRGEEVTISRFLRAVGLALVLLLVAGTVALLAVGAI
jgi:membrane protease YdiL (CAAX protease family)